MTTDEQSQFLTALADGSTLKDAAAAAGHSRQAFYDLRGRDTAFAQAWGDAYDEGTDVLEAEAQRRAVEGVTDFRLDKEGNERYFQRYSDTLLIFLLKSRRPGRFARFEISGPKGGPIPVEVAPSSEHLARVAGILAAAGVLGVGALADAAPGGSGGVQNNDETTPEST